jgi:hypothetical protein
MRHAVELALEHDLTESASRGYFNLSYLMAGRDQWTEALAVDLEGLEFARRRGNRQWEEAFKGHLHNNRFILGDWADFDVAVDDVRELGWDAVPWTVRLDVAGWLVPIRVACGRLDEARELMSFVPAEERAESQERAAIFVGRAAIAFGEGRYDASADGMVAAVNVRGTISAEHPYFKAGITGALDAAVALDDPERVGDVFERVHALSPGSRSPLVDAQLARYDAHVAARRSDAETADRRFRNATELLREVGARFWLAVVLLEHGELLAQERPEEAEPLLEEARETFERLEAGLWLDRLARLQSERMFA